MPTLITGTNPHKDFLCNTGGALTGNPVVGLKVKQQDGTTIDLRGREAWSLHELIRAGAVGCTPIDNPAPRWSDCIFKLRKRGLSVDTIHEAHKGAFAGTHGRYILRTALTVVSIDRRGQA